MKAEPRPTKDMNREGGTATANGRWFRRLVRRIHSIFSNTLPDIFCGNRACKNTQGFSADGSFICVTPRFDCDCIDWHTNGNKTFALKSLMLALNLSDEDIISEGVLSLGCRKHGKNGSIFRFTLIPRQNNWCIDTHTPNEKS
jgi:hypothetical protein